MPALLFLPPSSSGARRSDTGARRASDHEREQAADELARAFEAGRLDADELAVRLDVSYAARTSAELQWLTSDLPPARAPRVRWLPKLSVVVALGMLVPAALAFALAGIARLDALGQPPGATVLPVVAALLAATGVATTIFAVIIYRLKGRWT